MEPEQTRTYKLTPATSYKPRPVKWLMPGRIPYGGISIIAGSPGKGKSQLALALAADQTRHGQHALFIGSEDGMEDTVRPRLVAAGAELANFSNFDARIGNQDTSPAFPLDVPLLKAAVLETGASTVIIDPVGGHLEGTVNSHSDQSLRTALVPLARMAQETQCAVLCLMHLNKGREGSPLNWLNGGTAFGGVARSVLMFGSRRLDPFASPTRYLAHIKCNVGPMQDALVCEIEDVTVKDNDLFIPTSRLNKVGTSPNFNIQEME